MAAEASGRIESWVKRFSFGERLSLQTRTTLISSLLIIVAIVAGSLLSLRMIAQDNQGADQALSAALLEKDFASLERDVFRNALMRTAETTKDMEGNFGDMRTSIDAMRASLGEEDSALIDAIASNQAVYADRVHKALESGIPDASRLAAITEAGNEVDAAIEAVRNPIIARSEALARLQSLLAYITMAATVLIALGGGWLSYRISRSIRSTVGGELGQVSGLMGEITRGRYDVIVENIDRRDEIGDLSRAAVQLRDASLARDKAEREMRNMLSVVGDSLRQLADGDLRVALPELGEGYETLRHDFNRTIAALHDAMAAVARSAESIHAGSSEISRATIDLAQRSEKHAAELAGTAETIATVTAAVGTTSTRTAQADDFVRTAVREADSGSAVVQRAVDAMAKIETVTEEIGQIISAIDSLTFQTNLLALNAGVEAARAGDAGKGFAVVASEVRALAQRSAESAANIKKLIDSSTAQVASGVELVRQAGTAFGSIGSRIREITGIVSGISETSAEQARKLSSTNAVMSGMDSITQQNTAMVEESTASVRQLADEATNLAALVTRFRLHVATKAPPKAAGARPAAPRPQPPLARRRPAVTGNLALQTGEDWTEF